MNTFQKKYFLKQIKLAKKQALNRAEKIPVLSQSNNICVLCCFENEEQMQEILHVVNKYQGSQKRIRLLVYVEAKNCPLMLKNSLFVQPVLTSDFSFFGRPKENIKQYLKTSDFDILVNAATADCALISDFLSQLTSAEFKIGRASENTHLYHLILQIESNTNLTYYLETIEKYTLKLNGR